MKTGVLYLMLIFSCGGSCTDPSCRALSPFVAAAAAQSGRRGSRSGGCNPGNRGFDAECRTHARDWSGSCMPTGLDMAIWVLNPGNLYTARCTRTRVETISIATEEARLHRSLRTQCAIQNRCFPVDHASRTLGVP